MKYLQPSFTFAVSNPNNPLKRLAAKPKPKVGHRFLNFGGVCGECGLDRIGHRTKFGGGKNAR